MCYGGKMGEHHFWKSHQHHLPPVPNAAVASSQRFLSPDDHTWGVQTSLYISQWSISWLLSSSFPISVSCTIEIWPTAVLLCLPRHHSQKSYHHQCVARQFGQNPSFREIVTVILTLSCSLQSKRLWPFWPRLKAGPFVPAYSVLLHF